MRDMIMEYLERIATLSAEIGLSNNQSEIMRDITDPILDKDASCNIKDIRGIIAKLVEHEKCEELAELIQEKWQHIELEPNAYDDLADDVLCG